MPNARTLALFSLLVAALAIAGCRSSRSTMMEDEDAMMENEMMENATSFTVRIQNVSTPRTLQTSEGGKPVPLSPGVWAVHSGANPFFTPGQPASGGLELVAEDGFPMMLAQEMKQKMQMAMEDDRMEDDRMEDDRMEDDHMENDHMMEDRMMEESAVATSGVFAQPVGKDMNAPLLPGDAYEFTIQAQPGQRLSFVTMFVQSNDLFLAPSEAGLPLFDDGGHAMRGTMTSRVRLWDAGTEDNEEPGVGAHTKPKQGKTARDVGLKERRPVRRISRVDDGYDYPGAGQVLRVTVTPQ